MKGSAMVTKAQKKATIEYNKRTYDTIKLYVKKGKRSELKNKAIREHKSLNQYCLDKIYKE